MSTGPECPDCKKRLPEHVFGYITESGACLCEDCARARGLIGKAVLFSFGPIFANDIQVINRPEPGED